MKSKSFLCFLLVSVIFINSYKLTNAQPHKDATASKHDSTFLQIKALNLEVERDWSRLIEMYGKRNAQARLLIDVYDKAGQSSIKERNELYAISQAYLHTNTSSDILSDQEQLNRFDALVNDFGAKMGNALRYANTKKINPKDVNAVEMETAQIENRISVRRKKLSSSLLNFNKQLDANGDGFRKQYPEWKKKCYFAIPKGSEEAPRITF